MNNTPYEDIINLPHHVSRNHPQMPMRDRAAQFAPFAALVGYEDAVEETGRLIEQKRDLDVHVLAELSRRMVFLASHLAEQPEVCIEYFVPDERKAGGAYQTISSRVKKILESERVIVLYDDRFIPMDDIVSLSGKLFDSLE